MADIFGCSKITILNTRLDKDYKDLVEKIDWEGKNGSLRFQLHPLEKKLLEQLRNSSNSLKFEEIFGLARGMGYLENEVLISLELLAERHYISIDSNNECIFLERIKLTETELNNLLSNLERKLNLLAPLSDPATTSLLANELKATWNSFLLSSKNEEEIDDSYTELKEIEKEILSEAAIREGQLRQEIVGFDSKLEGTVSTLRQNEFLDKDILGTVSFVQHLNDSRTILKQKAESLRRKIRDERIQIQKIPKNNYPDAIDAVQNLYKIKEELFIRVNNLWSQGKELDNSFKNLKKWIELLQKTDNLHKNLKTEHTQDLGSRLNTTIDEIQAHFATYNIKALEDHELFYTKIKDIEGEFNQLQQSKNQAFYQLKESFHSSLRESGESDPILKAKYDIMNEAESYYDLYQEVKEKVDARLLNLGKQLDELRIDLRKADLKTESIAEDIELLDELNRRIQEFATKASATNESTSIEQIKDNEKFKLIIAEIIALSNAIEILRKDVGHIIHKTEYALTEEEQGVLEFFDKQEVDIIDILDKMIQSGKKIHLKDLLTILEELYGKNKVVIRVARHA
ncbi:MAG: hypothetical protein HPY61_07685 [Methanotrichaceae archaeon]|nr:hypothetical protein [Methanotrichaceae archaeon]